MQSKVSSVLLQRAPASTHFVLALSGGVDSCVLLQLLAQFLSEYPKFSAHTVYVDHGLSDHANDWAQSCQKWSNKLGLECVIERVSLSLHDGKSIEAEARHCRYEALKKHIKDGDVLLTAQHANDQMETFLLALKRGSGPAGLSAMPEMMPFGDGSLLRPLLNITRAEVLVYAKNQSLEWVEDESNQDTRYDRNFLRQNILPELTQRWPSLHKAMIRSAQLCAEQEALLDDLLKETLALRQQQDGSLCLSADDEVRKAKALIRLWLKGKGCLMPSHAQLQRIWEDVVCAQSDANPKVCVSQGEIRRFQGRLYWVEAFVDCVHWSAVLIENQACVLPSNLGKITLETDLIMNDSQLSLRCPIENEVVSIRFDPVGLMVKPVGRTAGRRQLKKLFQEYNVPSWQRRSTPLIFYGDQLVAVAGLFVVEGFDGNGCYLNWQR